MCRKAFCIIKYTEFVFRLISLVLEYLLYDFLYNNSSLLSHEDFMQANSLSQVFTSGTFGFSPKMLHFRSKPPCAI